MSLLYAFFVGKKGDSSTSNIANETQPSPNVSTQSPEHMSLSFVNCSKRSRTPIDLESKIYQQQLCSMDQVRWEGMRGWLPSEHIGANLTKFSNT